MSDDALYNDDFSDTDRDVYINHQEEQVDEQHAQKVNGKLETMQTKIDDLQHELDKEKNEHELSKRKVEGLLEEIKSKSKSKAVDSTSEVLKYKQQAENLKEKLEVSLSTPDGISTKLREEFVKFCSLNELNVSHIHNISDINEETIINILRLATKSIKSASSSVSKSTTSGGDRPHTSATTHVHSDPQVNDLLNRIKNLEYELRLALGAAEDIKALKAKLLQMVERIRTEKESKLKAEAEGANVKKKMDMLGDHMEKLMTHLKHEAASKIRAMEQLRLSEREVNRLKEKIGLMNKKNVAKDRLILELREGSKILEDQLRLMDEKYLELRTKLDYAREVGTKKVKQAEKTASELRIKFALAGNSTILDNVMLPDIHNGSTSNPPSGLEGSKSWMSYDSAGDAASSSMGASLSAGSKRSKKNSRKNNKMSQSVNSLGTDSMVMSQEPSMDVVLEKIRKQQGKKMDWSEDKLRDLTRSR